MHLNIYPTFAPATLTYWVVLAKGLHAHTHILQGITSVFQTQFQILSYFICWHKLYWVCQQESHNDDWRRKYSSSWQFVVHYIERASESATCNAKQTDLKWFMPLFACSLLLYSKELSASEQAGLHVIVLTYFNLMFFSNRGGKGLTA